jgi:hypothetical protein
MVVQVMRWIHAVRNDAPGGRPVIGRRTARDLQSLDVTSLIGVKKILGSISFELPHYMKLPCVASLIKIRCGALINIFGDNRLLPSDAKDRIRHEEVGRRFLIPVPDMRTLRLGSGQQYRDKARLSAKFPSQWVQAATAAFSAATGDRCGPGEGQCRAAPAALV